MGGFYFVLCFCFEKKLEKVVVEIKKGCSFAVANGVGGMIIEKSLQTFRYILGFIKGQKIFHFLFVL